MWTFAISNLKGGVGKSTLTLNIATCLHRAGHRALIIDADPQGSCRVWAARAAEVGQDGPPVAALEASALKRDLGRISAGFDAVVIDCPPRMGTETRAAMLASNMVVMPTCPGFFDVSALRETLAVFAEARMLREDLRGCIAMNRVERTSLSKLVERSLADQGVPMLDVSLKHRVVYGEALLAGAGVVDFAPASDGALEVRRFVRALMTMLGGAGEVAA